MLSLSKILEMWALIWAYNFLLQSRTKETKMRTHFYSQIPKRTEYRVLGCYYLLVKAGFYEAEYSIRSHENEVYHLWIPSYSLSRGFGENKKLRYENSQLFQKTWLNCGEEQQNHEIVRR